MDDIYAIRDTYQLLPAVERILPATHFLQDLFFPNKVQTYSDIVSLEYRKGNRTLAPFVTEGVIRAGLTAREKSQVRYYKAPVIGARRVIGIDEITGRLFGEAPIYSTKTAAERAADIQAMDLRELLNQVSARREKMAADLMQTGKIELERLAEDGKTVAAGEIDYGDSNIIEATDTWAAPTTDIYGQIKAICDTIAQDSGLLPNVMVVGTNVERYLLSNEEIYRWLTIPNAENLKMMSLAPQYDSPDSRFIGRINSLGLEVRSYQATYMNSAGIATKFLDDDTALIGIAKRGKYIYGSVNYLDMNGSWQTIAGENVPVYSYNMDAQATALTLLSRCLPVPDCLTDTYCIKVA